jgi:beta propeller repeat protein
VVKGKDISTGETFIVDGPAPDELDPVSNGSIVVWRDKRTGNFDLYAMDLQTAQQRTLVDEPHSQVEQAVSENYLVWKDWRHSQSGGLPEYGNADIYAMDLRTGQEFAVCTASYDQSGPGVDGNIIVWADKRRYVPGLTSTLISDIYGYDTATGQEFLIAAAQDGVPQTSPAISGNIVVWRDGHNGGDIMGYDISTGEAFPIHVESPDDYTGQTVPDIDGQYVVWVDGREGPDGAVWSIRGYDLLTSREFIVFQDAGYVTFPSISGNLLTWTWHPVGVDNERIMAAYIPEPASVCLLAAGGALLAARRRRRRSQA